MTNKALIIKKEWLDKIFDNGKCWEMRSTRTNITGVIQLIESGSGQIVGECVLSGCHKVNEKMAVENSNKHQVKDLSLLKKWSWAWLISEAKRYKSPVKYNHPQGAVIWVNLKGLRPT